MRVLYLGMTVFRGEYSLASATGLRTETVVLTCLEDDVFGRERGLSIGVSGILIAIYRALDVVVACKKLVLNGNSLEIAKKGKIKRKLLRKLE